MGVGSDHRLIPETWAALCAMAAGIDAIDLPTLRWITVFRDCDQQTCRSGQVSSLRIRGNRHYAYKPSLQLSVVVRAWIAGEIAVYSGGARDLRLQAKELIQGCRSLLEAACSRVINCKRRVHCL